MELQQFVESAILQVMRAVSSAQAEAEKIGGTVSPGNITTAVREGVTVRHVNSDKRLYPVVSAIEFDVCVESGESTEQGTGLQISAGGFGFGKDGKKSASESGTTSRLQFSIPVVLPMHRHVAKEFVEPKPPDTTPRRSRDDGGWVNSSRR